MELYTLDSSLRAVTVTDDFNSLIWTERYADLGDFQMVLDATSIHAKLFPIDTQVAINKSKRVMVVDTSEKKQADDGTTLLYISGHSLEIVLQDRVAANAQANLTTQPNWVIGPDTPGNVSRTIFKHVCVDGGLAAVDVLPFISYPATLYPTDTIVESAASITVTVTPSTTMLDNSVFATIKSICDNYNLGFRLYRGLDTSILYFNIYAGIDRTTGQTTYPAVVFGPELDNLFNIDELTSSAGYKNVAYVYAVNGNTIVYADGADATTTGFNRHVMMVDASDITDAAGATLNAKMLQRGNEALAGQKHTIAFDGEIPKSSSYVYDTHYSLGDLVELRNDDGISNAMKVTEQIFSQDDTGEYSYPTLALFQLITPGSWGAVSPATHWADESGTLHWADL